MFVNHPVTTSFSTLSLHDALPIYVAMFLRTNPLFEEPAIGFLDVLDLCGGTCVGRMPEAYQRGSNSDRLCDVPNSLSIRVYRPDHGTPGVHVQQHAVLVASLRYTTAIGRHWRPRSEERRVGKECSAQRMHAR